MVQTNNSLNIKILKYVLMSLVVALATRYIPDITIKTKEIVMIGAISGITFALLDIASPSIKIQEKNDSKVIVEKFN
jgi:hypothetical protein